MSFLSAFQARSNSEAVCGGAVGTLGLMVPRAGTEAAMPRRGAGALADGGGGAVVVEEGGRVVVEGRDGVWEDGRGGAGVG